MMATAFHPAGWTEMKSRLNVALEDVNESAYLVKEEAKWRN
mgnify:CR=1 FL=1|jgi:hypothetical protein